MHVDFKCTIWERITIPKHLEIQFVNAVKLGELTTANDAYSIFGGEMDNQYELLLDTSESMDVSENGGDATLEIYDDEVIIYDNTRKDE